MEALISILTLAGKVAVGMLMLTIIVAAHELGHYLFARMYGMHVNAFAVMVGGVRKTDLSPYLRAPMAPRWMLFVFGTAAFLLAFLGAFNENATAHQAGLALVGIALPIWIVLRLEALYHLPRFSGIKTLFIACGIGLAVLMIGSRGQGIALESTVGILIAASIVAMILVYYRPTGASGEEDKQGYGSIEIEGDEGKETVSVRYRPLLHRTSRSGTEFSLLVVPLGGFAAIKGMHAKPDGSEVDVPNGFYSKSPLKRWVVLFAGPLFSVVFGIALMVGLFTIVGENRPVNEPVIASVKEDSPADLAGLESGDRVISVNGRIVETFYDLTRGVKDSWRLEDGERVGVPLILTFERDGVTDTIALTPEITGEPLPGWNPDLTQSEEKEIRATLGVYYGTKYVRLSSSSALREAVQYPVLMVAGLAKMVVSPKSASDGLAGPATIAEFTGSAVERGLYPIISLMALLSISLGIMNLLPFPPMDGGQMIIAFVEMLRRGRRLSISVQNVLSQVGVAFIVVLFLTAITVDINRKAKERSSEQEQPSAQQESDQPIPPDDGSPE
ncbi:MAG: site-2 protease family protein [Armatimonadetes bacterium]|nr:site-2 protease family protein [Armatimonadota bacterium]